jgi:type I restriction-modification system DNA methylase subunit
MITKELQTNDYKKEFISLLENINKSKRASEVFYDWLIMAAAALYSWKKDKDVENDYLRVVKAYTKEQLDKFARLLAIIVKAMHEEKTDFLGNIFMQLNMGNKRLSQFFTPYNISSMMAEITLPDKINKKRIIKILDPSCGSGVMLISAASVLEKRDKNYQKYVLLVGQDIDSSCAYMTFIQLSILGVPAIVKCGDSIIDKINWQRETLWFHQYNIGPRLEKQEELEDKKSKKNNMISHILQKDLF